MLMTILSTVIYDVVVGSDRFVVNYVMSRAICAIKTKVFVGNTAINWSVCANRFVTKNLDFRSDKTLSIFVSFIFVSPYRQTIHQQRLIFDFRCYCGMKLNERRKTVVSFEDRSTQPFVC